MSEHLTMQQLDDLGVKLIKSSPCFEGDAVEQVRIKGCIRIDTLYWLNGNMDGYQRITIDPYFEITAERLAELDRVINE